MTLSISIVTPSYNQGIFIQRTIESVLSQDVAGLEYLVCDGGSRDETVTILEQYNGRLRWLSEADAGQADAVNKGIRLTRGEIIGWLNSDDIYYPNALNTVQQFFEEHPEIDVVYGRAHHIDVNDKIINTYDTEPWNYERLKETCFLCQPAVFFRRRLIEEKGLLDSRLQYCMDYEYWLRLGADRAFAYLETVYLAGSRLYDSNKTLGSRTAVHREIIDMTRARLGKTPERWIFNYAHVVADNRKYNRQTAAGRVKYISYLLLISPFYFLRWYHYIPLSALKTMWSWLTNPLYRSLREVFGS